jgi:predicted MFS family arabinose efflux permease
MSITLRSPRGERLSPAARTSILGGVITLFIDSYDIYLPALVLPAALGYFEPASMSSTLKATLDTIVFTVTLLGRPIGGPIFGNLADRVGRKRVAMITGIGFTVLTGLMACLPGYKQWGFASIGVLILLRLINGIFLGGGYAGPIPLAIERSPKRLRGLVGGIVVLGAPLAFIVISLIQLLVLDHLSESTFLVWGWRIPFVVGAILGLCYLAYFWKGVPEIEMQELQEAKKAKRPPLIELIRGPQARPLLQVVLLMTGMWFASQMTVSFQPVVLITVLHQAPDSVSHFLIVSSLITGVGMVLYGVLSQWIGRRAMLRWVAVSVLIIGSLSWLFMVRFADSGKSFTSIAVMAAIASFVTNAPLGVFVVYLNERFGTRVRAAGYSTAYTFGLILPGLYTVWVKGLAHIVPFAYTAMFLIPLGGLLVFIAATLGPETRDATLLEHETPAPETEPTAARVRSRRPERGVVTHS